MVRCLNPPPGMKYLSLHLLEMLQETANPPWGWSQLNTQPCSRLRFLPEQPILKTDPNGVLVLAGPTSLGHDILPLSDPASLPLLPQVFIMKTCLLNEMLYEPLSRRTRSQASYQFLPFYQAASCTSPGKKVLPVIFTLV